MNVKIQFNAKQVNNLPSAEQIVNDHPCRFPLDGTLRNTILAHPLRARTLDHKTKTAERFRLRQTEQFIDAPHCDGESMPKERLFV